MEKESTSFWADIKKYEDILAKDSRSYCFAPLSELYRKLGLLDDAVSVAKKGIEIHPEYIGGFMVLGRALFEQGNRDEARASLEKVALATPENLIAQKILSQIYQEEGNLVAAERALQHLVTFNPEDTESALSLEALQRSMQASKDDTLLFAPAFNATVEADAAEASVVSDSMAAEQTSSSFDLEDSCSGGNFAEAHVGSSSAGDALLEEDASAAESGILPLATVTLAELYEGQGFFEKALEVYADLLNKDPENQRLKERVIDLSMRLGTETVHSPVSGICINTGIVASNVPLGVSSDDPPGEDSGYLFPNGQGRNDNVLDLLGLWLDAIRRRKECR
jgi:tetratricopeptide (TPR) repeat protein